MHGSHNMNRAKLAKVLVACLDYTFVLKQITKSPDEIFQSLIAPQKCKTPRRFSTGKIKVSAMEPRCRKAQGGMRASTMKKNFHRCRHSVGGRSTLEAYFRRYHEWVESGQNSQACAHPRYLTAVTYQSRQRHRDNDRLSIACTRQAHISENTLISTRRCQEIYRSTASAVGDSLRVNN